MGSPDDPSLTPADESMGISEMAVIFMSLGVAAVNFKVAELFWVALQKQIRLERE